ncbi:MAG: tocopherol cyclase family protein [Promethearchaeota archaeon]
MDKKEQNIYAIIAGVTFDKREENPQAFIYFINGLEATAHYFKYSEFWYSKQHFEIKIGKNFFSLNKLSLDITERDHRIVGVLQSKDLNPWPIKLLSPGAMGWTTFVPFLECYHGVLSFNHPIRGKLNINGKEIDFSEGRAYFEKDWGKSFPRYWIWMQANHFKEEGTSVIASLANVKWLNFSFNAFIAGFHYKGTLYQFTSYSGAKITKLQLPENRVIFHLSSKKYRLELEATMGKGIELKVPVFGVMKEGLLESITGEIYVRFYQIEKGKTKLLFEGIGRNAGLDVGGAVDKLPLR